MMQQYELIEKKIEQLKYLVKIDLFSIAGIFIIFLFIFKLNDYLYFLRYASILFISILFIAVIILYCISILKILRRIKKLYKRYFQLTAKRADKDEMYG